MQKLLIIAIILILVGCIDESSLKPIIPYHVLHANSSKVWILQNRIVDGEDLAPQLRERKRTFTLFDDLQLFEQEMVHLGSNYGLLASYSMGIDEETQDTLFNIYYTNHNKKLKFKIKEIGYKTLVLQPITNDSIVEEWRLIPLNKSN
jgi:hypothetical protein